SVAPLLAEAYARGASAGSLFGRTRLLGFARTSGTLGEPKHVPMNAAWLASLDRTILRMVASHLYTGGEWETLLSGKRILLGSRPRCGTSPTGLPICDASGMIATRAWWSVRWLYSPRHRDHWIADWPTKAERILDQTHGKKVISISGIPALAMDLARRARERYGVETLDRVWPDLRQYVYGSVHLSSEQRAALRRSWFQSGAALRFFETYFSTETPLAFAFEPDDEGLALTTLENVFLFRPYSGDGSFLFAHELAEGGTYSIHVTTPGGLVNYRMGDRVEVLSTRPLRIRCVGREADEISMTGEKITLAQVDLALGAAGLGAARLGTHLPVVWVEPGERPRLVWGVPEVAAELREDPAWGQRLDEALCRLNVLYAEALRHEGVVGASRVVFLPVAVFEKYRESTLGLGQSKQARLFRTRAEFAAAYRWDEIPS
ncbi:MAG TPA: GH3 auxin-responsive promoter family protein, partial [bacterium]|nr:GH3 auxin-responsive promoter family protein [bacterium]